MNEKKIKEINNIIGSYATIISDDTNLVIEGEIGDREIRAISSIVYADRVLIEGKITFYNI